MQIDPTTYRRLAYIRYLHSLGVEQARLPEPQSYPCLLMLHDAVESLLVLVADHYGTSASKFEEYWKVLKTRVPGGGLTGLRGMQRLNRTRNDLKHNGVVPSAATIDQAVVDTGTFMSATVQAVYGLSYDEISMADLVSQIDVRDLVRAAEAAHTAGNVNEAMARIYEAFETLFEPHTAPRGLSPLPTSPFAFGSQGYRWLTGSELRRKLEVVLAPVTVAPRGRLGRVPDGHDVREVARELAIAADATLQMRRAVRMIVLGIDFPAYLRFDGLMPVPDDYADGRREYRAPKGYAPTEDQFRFCIEFVVTAALRLAAAETQQSEPAWMTRNSYGQLDAEWEKIAEVKRW